MSTCQHTPVVKARYGYTNPVFVRPYTDENPQAYGGAHIVERCVSCGAERNKLINGTHVEMGTWGPSEAEISERNRRVALARRQDTLFAFSVKVLEIDVKKHQVLIEKSGEKKWHKISDILDAKNQNWRDQPDVGALYNALAQVIDDEYQKLQPMDS